MVQVFVRNLDSRSVAYEIEAGCPVSQLKSQIEVRMRETSGRGGERCMEGLVLRACTSAVLPAAGFYIPRKHPTQVHEGIPSTSQCLVYSRRQLQDETPLVEYGVSSGSTLHLVLRLRGGKGGFGALLRGQGRDGKLTTNFDACRDLQGRRIRHQRTEEELREWARQSKERELEKVAMQHIKDLAKQQRAEAREQVWRMRDVHGPLCQVGACILHVTRQAPSFLSYFTP